MIRKAEPFCSTDGTGLSVLLSHGVVGRGGDAVQFLDIAQAFEEIGCQVRVAGVVPVRPYDFGPARVIRSAVRRLPWWARDLAELTLSGVALARAGTWVKSSPDLVLHRGDLYDFAGPCLARRVIRPLVAHLDAPFGLERAYRREGHFASLHRACARRLGDAAMLIATVSETSKGYYVDFGIAPEKILVLSNGLPTRLLVRGREMDSQHPPLQEQDRPITVGVVGSFSRWHRVNLLVEALARLQASGFDAWELHLIGHGEEAAKVRHAVEELGIPAHVRWIGALPREQAFNAIGRFDIAVLPHTLTTGVPLKLLEYAAWARPIVAPDLPNLRDLFRDDEVLFFPPEDVHALAGALRWLRENPEKAREMGRRAQERVQESTWENWVTKILRAVGLST